MRETSVDTLVIGAGVAGLAVAYRLAHRRGERIAVVDQAAALGDHASGRNAGMVRQALADPLLVRMARQGREELGRLSGKNWKGLRFRSIGSMLLAKGAEIEELRRTASALKKERIDHQWLSPQDASRRVFLLQGGDFEQALFCPSDAVVEIQSLLQGFVRELRARRVLVHLGLGLRGIVRTRCGFCVQAGSKRFFAAKIVNAAGAWASLVGAMAGGQRIPLTAYRRHLFYTGPMKIGRHWPFVWDVSHDFYFRPSGNGLLMSPCDKEPVRLRAKDAGKGERTDTRMKRILVGKLALFSDRLSRISPVGSKAGLRTLAPDGRFVIGEDRTLRGFFWVAGLGGHGVTTCFSVGRLAGDIILGRQVNQSLVKAFSPRRFLK